MKNLKRVLGIITIGISAGMLGNMGISASANSQYSAKR